MSRMKRTSWWEQKYSTVGLRVPICLRRMLLKIWHTSFFPCGRDPEPAAAALSQGQKDPQDRSRISLDFAISNRYQDKISKLIRHFYTESGHCME